MDTSEAAVILKAIVDLSSTMDALTKKNATAAEYFAYSKVSKVFMSLCDLDVSSDKQEDKLEIYRFQNERFERVLE